MTAAKRSPSYADAFRSVLIAVDLTPGSDRVLGRLALLPLPEDARVTLVHVVPEALATVEQYKAERDAKRALAEEAHHLEALLPKSASVQPVVRAGAAAKEIAACASEVGAELIVMGRGGGKVLRETFLGSTAERVVRQAQRPTLVVRLPARRAYRRPAIALDLDRAAREVVRVLLRVLPPPRPPVEVIHAFDIPYYGMIYPSFSDGEAAELKGELRARLAGELSAVLVEASADANVHPGERPPWKMNVRHGSPRVVVAKATHKAETDLLVLGTRGFSGAAYVFLGTVAGDLLRSARCDVLVVPPPPGS